MYPYDPRKSTLKSTSSDRDHDDYVRAEEVRKLTRGSPSVLVNREVVPGSGVVSWTVFCFSCS